MKRSTPVCFLIAMLGFALAAGAQETGKAKPKLAVLPFQNKAGNAWWYHGGAEAAQDVFVTELMKALQDVFVTELMGARRFEVVPPSALDAGFTLSDDLINAAKSEKALTSQRLYLAGFSNGGQMAARCTIEMSDKFAAIVESAGSFYADTIYVPLRKMPIAYQVGNEDYGPGNTGPSIPLSMLDSLLSTSTLPPPFSRFNRLAGVHVRSFALNPSFTISGDTNTVSIAMYMPLTPNPNNSFRFAMIKGLAHAYPNGTNHWLESAKVDWAWMKNYTLP